MTILEQQTELELRRRFEREVAQVLALARLTAYLNDDAQGLAALHAAIEDIAALRERLGVPL